jgi:hypothetical protein
MVKRCRARDPPAPIERLDLRDVAFPPEVIPPQPIAFASSGQSTEAAHVALRNAAGRSKDPLGVRAANHDPLPSPGGGGPVPHDGECAVGVTRDRRARSVRGLRVERELGPEGDRWAGRRSELRSDEGKENRQVAHGAPFWGSGRPLERLLSSSVRELISHRRPKVSRLGR